MLSLPNQQQQQQPPLRKYFAYQKASKPSPNISDGKCPFDLSTIVSAKMLTQFGHLKVLQFRKCLLPQL